MTERNAGFLWNILSSLAAAVSSVLLLMIVKRFAGIPIGAHFSMAIAVANVMIPIGHMNSFGYQVSDVLEKYSFPTYLKLRKVTVCLMIISALGYIWMQDISGQKADIIFWYCVYKAAYAYADVYQGRYQQKGRADLAAKLQFYKTWIPDSLLAIVVIVLKDVRNAIILAAAVQMLYLYWYNRKYDFYLYQDIKTKIQKRQCVLLYRQCMPLFFSAFTAAFILNSSKYSIDRILNNKAQVCYSILLLPATTVHMIAGFVYRPLLAEYAKDWSKGEYGKFKKQIEKVSGMMVAGVIAIEFLSDELLLPVLKWIYAVPELDYYKEAFHVLLLAGGMNAAVTFFGYVITIMRLQAHMFWIYGLTFVLAVFLPDILVEKGNVLGAAVSFAVLVGFELIMTVTVFFSGRFAMKKSADSMK